MYTHVPVCICACIFVHACKYFEREGESEKGDRINRTEIRVRKKGGKECSYYCLVKANHIWLADAPKRHKQHVYSTGIHKKLHNNITFNRGRGR